jgi:hypothetical protein
LDGYELLDFPPALIPPPSCQLSSFYVVFFAETVNSLHVFDWLTESLSNDSPGSDDVRSGRFMSVISSLRS